MQIARYFIFVAIAVIVILPIMAHRGRGYRRAWAIAVFLGGALAWLSLRVLSVNMALFHSTLNDEDLLEKFQKSRGEIDQIIAWSFVTFVCSAGFSIGSFLAVCFHRAKAGFEVAPQQSKDNA